MPCNGFLLSARPSFVIAGSVGSVSRKLGLQNPQRILLGGKGWPGQARLGHACPHVQHLFRKRNRAYVLEAISFFVFFSGSCNKTPKITRRPLWDSFRYTKGVFYVAIISQPLCVERLLSLSPLCLSLAHFHPPFLMLVVRVTVITHQFEPSDHLSHGEEAQHFGRDESHGG